VIITPLPSPSQHTADGTIRPPKIRLGRAIVPIAAAGRGYSQHPPALIIEAVPQHHFPRQANTLHCGWDIRPPKIRLGRAIVPIAAAGRGYSQHPPALIIEAVPQHHFPRQTNALHCGWDNPPSQNTPREGDCPNRSSGQRRSSQQHPVLIIEALP